MKNDLTKEEMDVIYEKVRLNHKAAEAKKWVNSMVEEKNISQSIAKKFEDYDYFQIAHIYIKNYVTNKSEDEQLQNAIMKYLERLKCPFVAFIKTGYTRDTQIYVEWKERIMLARIIGKMQNVQQ